MFSDQVLGHLTAIQMVSGLDSLYHSLKENLTSLTVISIFRILVQLLQATTVVMITHMTNLMVTSSFIFFQFRSDSGCDTKENNFIPK